MHSKTCLALSFCLLLFAHLSTAQNAFEEDTVHLSLESGRLEGSLLRPGKTNAVPLVIIIAGSGPTDRDGNNPMMKNHSLRMLAQGLADAGIASLRYDKRGVGGSLSAAIPEADLRFEDFAADAAAWVQKMEDSLDFSSVTIIGHSEGSLLGMLAAQKAGVDRFVSLAGAGQPAQEVLRQQLGAQPDYIREPALAVLERLEAGEQLTEVPPMLNSLFRPSVQPYLLSWFAYDPRQQISRLDIPVLIVQGSTDLQVEEASAQMLAKARADAQLEIIEGMNHVLKEAPAERQQNLATYYDPDKPVVPELINIIAGFIRAE
jgi:hypothetical protein